MRPWITTVFVGVTVAGCAAADIHHPAAAGSPTEAAAGRINPRAIPLGDGHVSTTPRVGYVDSCITHFPGGGSEVDGPWINKKAKTWDSLSKITVRGRVSWPAARMKVTVSGDRRLIRFNDLPTDHTTGVFPIASSDPAYRYDHNPNHIAAQSFSWNLPLNPTAAARPTCTGGGPIGVLSDGVVLYNALDGQGRDAAAHEILDWCGGHPDAANTYHHHEIPTCILDRTPNGRATLVGYAIDGYGIYAVKNAQGILPVDRDLDACHGTTSLVPWNGQMQRVYHYVATLECPYTVGCFHGTPLSLGHPSSRPAGGGQPVGGPPPSGGAGLP